MKKIVFLALIFVSSLCSAQIFEMPNSTVTIDIPAQFKQLTQQEIETEFLTAGTKPNYVFMDRDNSLYAIFFIFQIPKEAEFIDLIGASEIVKPLIGAKKWLVDEAREEDNGQMIHYELIMEHPKGDKFAIVKIFLIEDQLVMFGVTAPNDKLIDSQDKMLRNISDSIKY